jgi:hypothetical protein
MSDRVKIVSRFKDPGIDAQMREVVKAANDLFGGLDTHAGRTDNPHQVTAAQAGAETPTGAKAKVDAHANRTDNPHQVTASQVGAETPTGAQAKANAAAAVVQQNLNTFIALMGDYVWKKNATTGNLELYKGTTKLADVDASGNLRIKGVLSQNVVF